MFTLDLPRWGREPGASPQRGEAGRGGSTRRTMVTAALRPASARGRRPLPPTRWARVWGNPVSPCPCARAAPAQPLPRAGAGVRGPPARIRARAAPAQPLPRAGAGVRGPPARIRARAAPAPTHPLGEGVGKLGFPMPLRGGSALSLKQVLRAKLRRQARILLQTPLLIAGHQVDIELIDADRRQFCQAAAVLLWRANDAEPVHHLIAHKGGVG